MKVFVVMVYFGVFGGVVETEAQFADSVEECHEIGNHATAYARQRPDIESYSYACMTFPAKLIGGAE